MKTLVRSLAAILSVSLSSAAFAASDDGWITGTVASVTKDGDFAIDEGKHDGSGNFELIPAGDVQTPKVGEKVRVHYYHCGSGRKGFHHCADKIEKLGKAEGGSKKR